MSTADAHSASRMGTAPMGPLLFSLAIPMMVSMLFQALYNVVDSIFVSYINEAALSAVSLAFPIQNLMIAFAVGTGVGVNAYVSKSLGEGNRAEADRACRQRPVPGPVHLCGVFPLRVVRRAGLHELPDQL